MSRRRRHARTAAVLASCWLAVALVPAGASASDTATPLLDDIRSQITPLAGRLAALQQQAETLRRQWRSANEERTRLDAAATSLDAGIGAAPSRLRASLRLLTGVPTLRAARDVARAATEARRRDLVHASTDAEQVVVEIGTVNRQANALGAAIQQERTRAEAARAAAAAAGNATARAAAGDGAALDSPQYGWGGLGTQPVSRASLDAYMKSKGSPMAGSGAAFLAAGTAHDVDPRLLVAIAGAESSFGQVLCAPYNAWGYGCPNGPFRFTGWADATDTVAKGLREHYLDDGLTSVRQIHARYAPVGATNDPTGLNLAWEINVANFLVEQGGNPDYVERDVVGRGVTGTD